MTRLKAGYKKPEIVPIGAARRFIRPKSQKSAFYTIY
jgi:hypothetical protein